MSVRSRARASAAEQALPPCHCRRLGALLSCRCSPAAFSTPSARRSIDIPVRLSGAGQADAAPPALDWWRGFRSRRAHRPDRRSADRQFRHRGRDRAHHPGRRAEQDRRRTAAAVRRFSTPASRARGRPADRSARPIGPHSTASYEIDFWGKNRATSRAAQENAIAARFDRDVVVPSAPWSASATAYFLVLVVTGPAADREPERRGREPRARPDPAAAGSRHRLRARSRAAGNVVASQRAQIPLLDEVLAAEHRHARTADRARAGVRAGARRQPLFARNSARARRPAVGAAQPAPRHPRRRGAAGRRRRQRRSGARGVLPEHHADRARRLHQHRAAALFRPELAFYSRRRRADAADLRRLPAGGPVGTGARPADSNCSASTARRWCRDSPTSKGR